MTAGCNVSFHTECIHELLQLSDTVVVLRALCLVWATTAANAHESSYACYYDSRRKTYLGDVYSVNWMEDSDKVCTVIIMMVVWYFYLRNNFNR